MSEIQLGLGSKNYGQVETSELKGGIRREQLKTDEQKSIFDAVDVDKNGILDESEVQKFTEKLEDAAGNEKLSKREAKKFLKEQNLKNIDKEELFNFVNDLKENSENITDSKVIENENGEKTILVTYKDGSQETINPDRTSQLVSTNQNNAVTTKFFDENRKLTKEQVVEENGDSTVTDIVDGLPVKKTSVENNGTKTSVVEYEDGKEVHKKVTEGTKESEYQYVDGKPVLSRKVEDLGNDIKRTTDYTYNQDGTVTEKITEPDKYNVRQVKDGKVLSEVITDSQNRKTERLYRDDNITQEVVTDGENKTATLYNTETGKRLQQAKLVNGQQYAIEYDGNGNTKGIIVQNGESISDIARKFGCSEKQLKEVNKDILKGKNYFDVGAEIKIPREIEADAKVLKGRKPAEIAKAEYARDAEIRRQKAKAAAEEKAYYQKLGVKSFNNKGKKVKADGWGNKEFEIVGQLGYARQLVKRDGKLYTLSHDSKILREDYLEAHRAFVSKAKNQRNNTASGIKDVTYVKDSNGKVWYFDEKTGKAIVKGGYNKIVKEESAFISNQLYKAAKGAGTDEELLKKGVNNIYSRDILKGVNAELKTKSSDYAGDAQTMPVEALILDEMSHGAARPVFKALIDSGTMTVEEQAHTIKREIEHEVHGGILGYTSTSDLNEVMQLTDNRDVRLEIEAQFKKDYPELKENEGSVVRQYIAEDGWNAQEVDQFDANWVKTGAYSEAKYVYQTNEKGEIVLDKNGKPVVVLDEGDQAHRNGVIGRLVFDYKDKEALNKGLEAVNDNPNSFDYQYLDSRAGEEIAKDPNGKYQSRFTDQDNIQRYLAGFHTDENGAVDAGNVSASNTCLFKGLKPARVQAEEALYKAQQGDYSQTFDSMDTETYSEIANLVANGDVKGVKNMTDLYNKAINSAKDANSKTKIKANAMISGQIEFSDKEITDFCVELMHSIDTNRGQGGSTGVSAKYTNSANEQTEQLKAILQNNPQVMDAVKARVEKEDFSYTTTTQTGGGSASMPTTTMHTTNTKDVYRQLLADTKNVVSESVFYDSEGNKITDPQQIEALKEANMQALGEMRNYVAELEREFKKGVDAEGWLSDAANGLSTYSGLGTDRDDVATEYKNAKVMLSQLEAAAQGRLRDSKGNVVSVQDLAKQVVDKQNSLATTNSDYKQTIAYGKMGIVLAPVMVVTTVASGGAAAAGWGTLATAAVGGVAAGATTYGVNAIEYNTSYTGNTAEAREQNLEDSLVNGVTTAIGIGQMKYIAGMANNMGTVARTGVRLATTVAADTGAGALSEYATTGDISTDGTMSNMIMSGVGNVIGAKSLGKKVSAASASHSRPDVSFNKKRAIEDVDFAHNVEQPNFGSRDSQVFADKGDSSVLKSTVSSDTPNLNHKNSVVAETDAVEVVADKSASFSASDVATPKTEFAKTSESILHQATLIDETQIPQQHKGLWNSCKERLSSLTQDISALSANVYPKDLLIKGKALLADIKTIALSATGSVRNAMGKLYNDLVSMLNSIKVKAQSLKISSSQNSFNKITTEKDGIAYYNKIVEDRSVIFGSSDPNVTKRSARNVKDGNFYFYDVDGWRYEIYDSSGKGNIDQAYRTQLSQRKTLWKMHIYADSAQEWANAAQVALPVIHENNVIYKTMVGVDKEAFDALSNVVENGKHTQKGKAFTLYFRSEDEFVKTAKQLDAAFQKSGLKSSGTVGTEAQIGESGFLSYRHEKAGRGVSYKPDDVEDPYLNSLKSEQMSVQQGSASKINTGTDAQSTVALSEEIKSIFSNETQQKFATLKPGQQVSVTKSNIKYIVRNNNGKIDIVAQGAVNPNKNVVRNITSTTESAELKATFSEETRSKLLQNLKPGDTAQLEKGDIRYIVRNNNGEIDIVAQGSINSNMNIQKPQAKLSAEVNSTFSDSTKQSLLEDLQPGQSIQLSKGDVNYIVRNNNGEIDIVAQGVVISKANTFNSVPTLSSDITSRFSKETQMYLRDNLLQNQSVRLESGNFAYIVRNNNGKIELVAQGLINPNIQEITVSNEVSSAFGKETQKYLKDNLLQSETVQLEKGDIQYLVENKNGTIEIVSKLNKNELVRNVGNDGKPIDKKYIKTSLEAREYLQDAINSGKYTSSLDSYIATINEMHVVSAEGKSGLDGWYDNVGQGSLAVNPGVIRSGSGRLQNQRITSAQKCEVIAKKYGDGYRTNKTSVLNLKGIPESYQPYDLSGGIHVYPDGNSLETFYYKEMYRTAKETVSLINSGASKNQILEKIAEHYQYAANARPYGQINNSLFMNETNTLLQMAGFSTIPHGILDIASMHLQPDTFKKYFVDQYLKTALN